MKKVAKILLPVLSVLFLFLGFIASFSALWYVEVFGDTGFDSILSTLFGGMGGTGGGLVTSFLLRSLLPGVLCTAVVGFLLLVRTKRSLVAVFGGKKRMRLFPFSRVFSAVLSFLLMLTLLFGAAGRSGLLSYLQAVMQQSALYERYYVDPAKAQIQFPEQKRNLVYIYLESMETTFFSVEEGGGNDVNVIPELYGLARENVNFSHNESVGGFSALSGGTWTIGALVSQTAGIPLKVPLGVDGNEYGKDGFLPGVTALSDLLRDAGYRQALMVGSDANFGSRKSYYLQHGTEVFDLYTAREEGFVSSDYFTWWGLEDAKLFEYAKEKLQLLSEGSQPFALTLLTVDTHHVDGYLCADCGSEYGLQYENVLACSSKRVAAFVEWLQAQDFYENTTVILCGDHPTMDANYANNGLEYPCEPRVYNCFINAAATAENTKNRQFCSLDLFPTTLAAMGCTIEGNRLGLGTNLFSSEQTLCERLGVAAFHGELQKSSDYYDRKFYSENPDPQKRGGEA